jgi:hypothetical protein
VDVKYPRTAHLALSPGVGSDDLVMPWSSSEEVVVTEKMDGENTTMTSTRVHARSLDTAAHPSRDWVRALHGRVRRELPEDWRICGENVYARHSLGYADLESYFLVFSVWDGLECLSWDDTLEVCDALDLAVVPVLGRGHYASEAELLELWKRSRTEDASEGFVVRPSGSFLAEEFSTRVGKWVRKGHVQTSSHWMSQLVVPNGLKDM